MSGANADLLVRHSHRVWLYLLGGLVLFFLILPILIVIPMSFSSSRYLDFPPQAWSLRWYTEYFASADWLSATWVSLRVAALTLLVATPLGVAAAYGIHASGRNFMRRIELFLLLPLMIPSMIVAVGIFFVFARLNLVGTMPGIVLAHTMHALPFVVVTALAGLRQYDMGQELAARSLGWSRLGAFLRVTLPQIKGSVLSGALFAFISSLDEVIISIFISSGENSTLTKIMFTTLRDELDPRIASVSSMLIVLSLLIGLGAILFGRHRRTAA